MNAHICALVVLLAGCLFGVASPWICIGLRRDTATSAWGTPPVDTLQPTTRDLPDSFLRHLQGRSIWGWILIGCTLLVFRGLILCTPDHEAEVTISYICCWISSALVLNAAWRRVGRPNKVPVGLLANFFIHGGVLGTFFASFINSSLKALWGELSPNCNLQTMQRTPACHVGAAAMWVLTPGLVEETFKSVWLFFRLRRGPEDVPRRCCLCLPSFRAYDCGCWYKLAPTPYHVFLCALASGAGFECMENLVYVFLHSGVLLSGSSDAPSEDAPSKNVDPWELMLFIAMTRAVFSLMHMLWTGFVGLGLAAHLFLPEERRPRLITILLPSMCLHGFFDYALSALRAANPLVAVLLLLSLVTVSIGSFVVICFLTGCRKNSCCCAPGFFERLYQGGEQEGISLVGLPVRTSDPMVVVVVEAAAPWQ